VALGIPREQVIWWVPSYEWYNEQIVEWSLEEGMRLHNFTRGTLSSADYTTADAPMFAVACGLSLFDPASDTGGVLLIRGGMGLQGA
jgi:hypothetical protein